MKTADARLIALALFALALALPVSAWIGRGHFAAGSPQNTAASEAVVEPVLVSPYQIVETRQGIFRLTRGNGESCIYLKGRWVAIHGD